jgi:hypothetical protein
VAPASSGCSTSDDQRRTALRRLNAGDETAVMSGPICEQVRAGGRKVFAVGFNKTGTSSLHALFQLLGLRSYHGTAWRDCRDRALLSRYDCFSDGIPADLAALDEGFPGSRFILQVRDLDRWIYSRLGHIDREKRQGVSHTDERWDSTEYAVRAWIRQRNEHHLQVLSRFRERPQDLLVVNYIRDQSAAARICDFLGFTGRYPKPDRNRNPQSTPLPDYARMLSGAAGVLGVPPGELSCDILCLSLLPVAVQERYPADTAQLEILQR